MAKRCRHQIVYDILKVLQHNSPNFVKNVMEQAKIHDERMRQEYIELMDSSNLIAVTGTSLGDMMTSGFNSHNYLTFYEKIEKVLNE